ncbi:glycosyltransferase [Salinisphaera sp. C84B14]|uniref:glycosyltransferase family 4 protein n=1 Tax=Salinisphaera sp. C84B14 TaxID=1304155 RepID=UPI0033419ABE
MRIGLVFNRFRSDGGTERITLNAFQALAQDNVDWVVLARNWGGPAEEGIEFVRCNPFSIGRAWRLLAFVRGVRKELKRIQVDWVQAQVHIPEADIFRADGGAHAEWIRQRRRVDRGVKGWLREVGPYHRLKQRMERRMYASDRLQAVICNSEMVKADIERHYPDCRATLHVIDYGIDLEHFERSDARANQGRELRRELGIAQNAPVFTYVGSGFERKGLATAIRALAKATESAHLIVVGRDSRLAGYRHLAKRLGISTRVHFMQAQSDVRPYLWAADALVHPALYEAFGLVILEAMAAGLPVIASTRTGAALALVDAPEKGSLHDALDVDGFAGAMTAIHNRDEAARAAARSACEQAAAPYTIDRMRSNLLAFYAGLQ